jgi:hypothetical protein
MLVARDIAYRAEWFTIDKLTGELWGLALVLKHEVIRTEQRIKAVEQIQGFVEEDLAEAGDEMAKQAIQERAKDKQESDEETYAAMRRAKRKLPPKSARTKKPKREE